MSQSRFTRAPGITAAAVVASLYAVSAQAGPAQTIYAAENALYGAGHEIGKADGWMDNPLRSAVRQYQSGNDELQATGNLDPQTLSALGIAPEDNSTISDNAVPDRKAAMAALGLSEERFDSGSNSRRIAVAPAPAPEPEVQPEPEVAIQEKAETDPAAPTPAEPEVVPTEEPTPEPELTAQTSEPVPESNRKPEPEPEPEPELTVAEPEKETIVEVSTVEESPETDFQLPDEPTAAGNPEVSETSDVSEPPAQSSGGFFSSVFDFLFGWLI